MATSRTKTKRLSRAIRHRRIRARVSGTRERPRLSVYRSNRYMYAQLIDDSSNTTLVEAHDETKKGVKPSAKLVRAESVGKALAEKAKAKKISKVVFDRSGFRYAGRIRALAEGARKGGLQF